MSEMTYKPKLLCVPHDGSRSPEYLKFRRAFRAGCIAEFMQDDEFSAWAAMQDVAGSFCEYVARWYSYGC